MSPARLRLAAEHLRLNAQCLFESCTINGEWDGEHHDEKQDCDEMRILADELDAHAADQDDIWRMATAPREPLTREDKERGARLFSAVGARLAQEAANMPINPANEDETCDGYSSTDNLMNAASLPNVEANGAASAPVQRPVGRLNNEQGDKL